jgi:1-acyl-sn-glycerol-3-phosphate acyltransferase
MKYLISIYAWVAAGLYFLLFSFFAIFLSLFMAPERFDPFLKLCMKLLFKIIFVKVRVEGKEHVLSGQAYLFMSNHTSMFDIPLFEAYIPTFVRGVEAHHQFKWPVYGWLIQRMGNIPIDRKNIHSSIRSIRKSGGRLKKGKSILILPEGTRTRDGKMLPFKKLPFFLAKEAGVPIVPIGISGLFQLKNKNSWLIRPRPISIRFGPPISSKTIETLSLEELRDLIRQKISDLVD